MILILIGLLIIAAVTIDRLVFPWHGTDDPYKYNIFGKNQFGRNREEQKKRNEEYSKKFNRRKS
jgi:hypothetical protein